MFLTQILSQKKSTSQVVVYLAYVFWEKFWVQNSVFLISRRLPGIQDEVS
jgi:hypothetical protein